MALMFFVRRQDDDRRFVGNRKCATRQDAGAKGAAEETKEVGFPRYAIVARHDAEDKAPVQDDDEKGDG